MPSGSLPGSPKKRPSTRRYSQPLLADNAFAQDLYRSICRSNPCRTKVRPGNDVVHAFESFVLGPGEKKVEMEPDTRVPSTVIFTFNKEDHTLGNLLRSQLLKNQHVHFAGYKVPHPLVHKVLLRVQTDGTVTPKDALLTACHELVKDLGTLSREFTKEFELRKMASAEPQQQNAQNGA